MKFAERIEQINASQTAHFSTLIAALNQKGRKVMTLPWVNRDIRPPPV